MSKVKFNEITGDRVRFIPISLLDVDAIHSFASDADVSRFIGWPLMTSVQETEEYIKEMMEREVKKTYMYASLVEKGTEEIIGCVMLFNFNFESNNAEIGYVIHKSHWGKGYTSEAVGLINKYAFEELKLHKINARVVDTNIGSAKVLTKNGYLKEGCFKDHYYIENRYYDGLFYGIISEDN